MSCWNMTCRYTWYCSCREDARGSGFLRFYSVMRWVMANGTRRSTFYYAVYFHKFVGPFVTFPQCTCTRFTFSASRTSNSKLEVSSQQSPERRIETQQYHYNISSLVDCDLLALNYSNTMISRKNKKKGRRMKTIVHNSLFSLLFVVMLLQNIPASTSRHLTTDSSRSLQTNNDCVIFRSALNYTEMQGMVPLEEEDALGWLDLYDWVIYEVRLPPTKSSNYYEIEWTVASPEGEGDILATHAKTRQYFTHLYGMPVTDDWGVYRTITTNISIPSNETIPLKIQVLKSGFNLRSFCIRAKSYDDAAAEPSVAPSVAATDFVPDVVDIETPLFQNPTDSCDVTYQAAREYSQMQGMTVQGKQVSNLAWLDPGDFVAYDITLPEQGWYQLHFGVASPTGEGAFILKTTFRNSTQSISQIPVTHNWYTYDTVSTGLIYLLRGSQRITLTVQQGGWNFRWWCWDLIQADSRTTPTDAPTSVPTSFTDSATGFVRAEGTEIRDPQDNPLLFRGVALGGWMAPHLVLPSKHTSAQDWWNLVETTVGAAKRQTFRQAWLEQFATQEDLQQIKLAGFNVVRVPLHYQVFTLPIQDEPIQGFDTWLSFGFRLLDQLMEWAADEELYVLLDLQAAPGGQGLDPVTDYNVNQPSLWEEFENRRKTVALWQELARRYADHPWVAGYDLLSAVDWNFQENEWDTRHWNGCDEVSNEPLRVFYEQAIAAIRQVDPHHMIVLAANCWGSNHNGLLPVDDTNVALGFHLYGHGNSVVKSMEPFLAARNEYNVPLIMTQTGGNSMDEWSAEMIQELESDEIGWVFWTWKSMSTTSSPFQIGSTVSFNTLVEYWENDCNNIHVESAFRALMQVANNTRISETQSIESTVETLLGTFNER